MQSSAQLLERWGYEVIVRPAGETSHDLRNSILIVDQDALGPLSESQPNDLPIIVLASEAPDNLPEGMHALPLPLRPAKLRALIGRASENALEIDAVARHGNQRLGTAADP